MTNETVPELPDWVKVLINDAREEGWDSGFQAGKTQALTEMAEYATSRSRAW